MTQRHDSVVLCSESAGVATLTLNRPDRLNAWNGDMQKSLFGELDRLADSPDVRAVVLTGAGRGFCGGADMEVLQDPTEEDTESSLPLFAPICFPKPLIAAINGPCAGIGLQIALMCDVRIASATAKFTTAFARRGLIAEHGLSWLLPRLTSLAVATDLLMSGRVFTGAEARDLGVVSRAVPAETVLAEARAYAQDLADNVSPTAMAVIKWEMYNHYDRPLTEVIDHSDVLMRESLQRPDLAEGVASFLERRPPRFAPLDRAAIPTSAFSTALKAPN